MYGWFMRDTQDIIDNLYLQVLIKTFWLLLYGYITFLNIIFTIISYAFLFKYKMLQH